MQPTTSKLDRSLSSAHGHCPQIMRAEKALASHQPSLKTVVITPFSIRPSYGPQHRPIHLACRSRGPSTNTHGICVLRKQSSELRGTKKSPKPLPDVVHICAEPLTV
jgi:hypothetical protein